MNLVSTIKNGYHKLLPFTVRDKVWRMRDRSVRAVRNFPTESQKKTSHFGRYLNFRFTGRCNACRGKRIVRYMNPAVARVPFSFYRCRDCGFIFVAPLPQIDSFYDEHTSPDFGEGEGIWNNHYLTSIEKHATGRGKLLEIGFGNANFLKLAHEAGWQVHGVELSVGQAEYARRELKLPNIRIGAVEELGYPDDFFDVVAGFNFLEHVPDPRRTLQEIRRILRPRGLVALMCPNMSGIYHLLVDEILGEKDPLNLSWVPPAHLSYFNKNSLRVLMEDVGFTVVGDESHLMNSLWRQHEVTIGPKVTGEKLARLRSEIESSSLPKGEARVARYHQELRRLMIERMAWLMISDLMELEPVLGAESALLFLGEKTGAK
ncbi:MAG TPA: class I SAM-dependent methyltransferase [Pyrinomonadaceae bacterium]|jgi:SAM-dependent methyltransferase|nr:class I SAM-dependent methyltransferase [Pyrinomonadaceae bacterium]